MAQTPPGWHSDPYGRFQQRYWDGSTWTEHVATGGQQQTDPLGTSTVVPFAIPPTALPGSPEAAAEPTQACAAPAASPAGGRVVATLDAMRPDSEQRRTPSLTAALAGLGGALVAFGGLIATGEDPSEGAIIAVSLVIIAAAVAAKWRFGDRAQVGAASLGALIVGLVGLGAGVALATDNGPGVLSFGLVGGLHLAAWLLKPFRGKTLLLGLGSLVLVGALASLPDAFDGGSFSDFEDTGNEVLPGFFTDSVGTTGWIYLLSSAGLFGATWWLDRKHYRGTATGLAASGLVAATIGTSLLADDIGDTGGAFLVTVVGVLVCLVGSHGARRATTWWGAALATIGLIALLVSILEPSSPASDATVALLAGALLIGAPALVALVRRGQQSSSATSSRAATADPTRS